MSYCPGISPTNFCNVRDTCVKYKPVDSHSVGVWWASMPVTSISEGCEFYEQTEITSSRVEECPTNNKTTKD